MFTKVKIGFIAILILALVLGLKAFWFVFTGILYYGTVAVFIALLVYLYTKVNKKKRL